MKQTSIFLCFLLLGMMAVAQTLKISAEVRPRGEYRHGVKSPLPQNEDPAAIISQRARIKVDYADETEKIKLRVALQNINVWGDIPTLSRTEVNGTGVYEAWGEVALSKHLSAKLGRQIINYDDQRILGATEWAQQARRHDALVAKYKSGKHRLHLGLALNADREDLLYTPYYTSYKNMQYLWYHNKKSIDSLTFSILAMNVGQPYEDNQRLQKIAYNQTLGSRIIYAPRKLEAALAFYYQMGKTKTVDLAAWYLAGELKYAFVPRWKLVLGTEQLSGTDMGSGGDQNKSFNPLFGTNHKFNGLIDYFYVGNHINSVGLSDLYGGLLYKQNRFSLYLRQHFFSAQARIMDASGNDIDKNLGTESDLVFGYKLTGSVFIKGGYSHMFETESMQALKGVTTDRQNNWVWLMVTFKSKAAVLKGEQ